MHIATKRGDTAPRDGQRSLASDILAAMTTLGHFAGEAPTGSGKSFAALVPAMVLAATRQERTIISTQTIGLQSQVVDKDAPDVARAVYEITGYRPSYSVLKGWSNHVCLLGTVATIQNLVETIPSDPPACDDPTTVLEHLERSVTVEPHTKQLLSWALTEAISGGKGDRVACPSPVTNEEWRTVSTKSDACPGDECLYYMQCLPRKARSRAGSADVIVANHALLAVQATTGAPVVIGSRHLRPIDHLVIDEAHALVDVVRNQGSVFINAQRLISAHRAVDRVIDLTSDEGQRSPLAVHLADTNDLATMLDGELTRRLPQRPGGSPKAIKDDPGLDALLRMLVAWVRALQELLPPAPSTRSAKAERKFRQMHAKVDRLLSNLLTALRNDNDVARWVEYDQTPVLKLSPVDVSSMLRANLFEFVAEDEPEPGQKRGKPRPPVSVSAMSATMPSNFAGESGLSVDTKQYQSPFAAAYEASKLYVPKLDPEALEALTTPDRNGKPSLDLARHQTWAATLITKLVRANAGSALVLSATSAAGQRYVEELRADADGWTVYSQWGGTSVPQVTAEWREDRNSVLVGTRSLMTGVDAVGDTCSLVIVDRVPRARGNVVDNARVEHVRKQQRVDHRSALRLVYVADAALLLEQATGRLIRSVDDAGMVAVLDPRLIPDTECSYPEPNRQVIRAGLARFPSHTRITAEDDALAYLQRQAAARNALVSVR